MADKTPDLTGQSFARCLVRVQEALSVRGIQIDQGRIVTSRDADMAGLREALMVPNLPEGFHKWQVPVSHDGPTHLFITVADPGATVPNHAHNDGANARFIASGSITFQGKELTAGDWMFIPAGAEYSFTVGPYGAMMLGSYQC